MTGIVERLVADFRWRLSSAGKRWRPKKKELQRLGAKKFPASAMWLIWGAYMLFCLVGAPALINVSQESWIWLLFQWPAWIASFVGLNWFRGAFNRNQMVKAYGDSLHKFERYTLVEYSRYLQRQIDEAREDEGLGGPQEVKRLAELRRQLNQLLAKHDYGAQGGLESKLADEAEFASAVIESLDDIANPLESLDSRLPEEIRSQLESLELQERQGESSSRRRERN